MILGSLEIPTIAIKPFARSRGWDFARQPVIEGPPRAQYVADAAPGMTLSLMLHASYCRPKEILDALIAMGDTHDAHILQSDDGTILGQFVIEEVSDKQRWTLPDGPLLACEVDITLGDPGLDTPLARTKAAPLAYIELDDVAPGEEYYELDDDYPDDADIIELDEPGDIPTSEIARV